VFQKPPQNHILTVGSKAKTHRTFKHFWFFADTHSRHKKPKKLKFLPPLKKKTGLLEQDRLTHDLRKTIQTSLTIIIEKTISITGDIISST